jgi:hypothetical protein
MKAEAEKVNQSGPFRPVKGNQGGFRVVPSPHFTPDGRTRIPLTPDTRVCIRPLQSMGEGVPIGSLPHNHPVYHYCHLFNKNGGDFTGNPLKTSTGDPSARLLRNQPKAGTMGSLVCYYCRTIERVETDPGAASRGIPQECVQVRGPDAPEKGGRSDSPYINGDGAHPDVTVQDLQHSSVLIVESPTGTGKSTAVLGLILEASGFNSLPDGACKPSQVAPHLPTAALVVPLIALGEQITRTFNTALFQGMGKKARAREARFFSEPVVEKVRAQLDMASAAAEPQLKEAFLGNARRMATLHNAPDTLQWAELYLAKRVAWYQTLKDQLSPAEADKHGQKPPKKKAKKNVQGERASAAQKVSGGGDIYMTEHLCLHRDRRGHARREAHQQPGHDLHHHQLPPSPIPCILRRDAVPGD